MFFVKLFKNPEEVNVLQMNLELLQKFGILSHYSSDTKLYKKILDKVLKISLTLINVQFLLGTCIEFYFSFGDFESLVIGFMFIVTHIKSIVKFGSFLMYRENFLKLISSIEDNRFIKTVQHTRNEISLVKTYTSHATNIAQYLLIVYIVTSLGTFMNIQKPDIGGLSTNLTDTEIKRVSAFRTWLPVKGVQSPYFEFVTTYEFVTLLTYAFYVTVLHTTIVVLMIHVTGQFSLLAESILTTPDHLVEDAEEDRGLTPGQSAPVKENKVMAHKRLEEHFRSCVIYHQLILNEVTILDKVLSLFMATQILTSSIFFALIGVLITHFPQNQGVSFYVAALAYVMMETGLLCWIATQLTIQGERVGEAAYSCMWYEYPHNIKKSLIFIIARSQKPVVLSIGPFGTLSMELFGKILNSAYSYFTLLRDSNRN